MIMAKHFLYHIFRMDKAENPMPEEKKQSLLRWLQSIFQREKGEA